MTEKQGLCTARDPKMSRIVWHHSAAMTLLIDFVRVASLDRFVRLMVLGAELSTTLPNFIRIRFRIVADCEVNSPHRPHALFRKHIDSSIACRMLASMGTHAVTHR